MRSFDFNLPGRPPLFIKHSDDILDEASTQHFFYLLANSDESSPRVPRVFDAFYSEEGYCLMATEKIAAPTLSDCGISEEEAVEHAASAVKWLLDQLPSVPHACFGRISSKPAPVWHQFFKEHQAPRAFADPDELAEYVTKASQLCRPNARPSSPVMKELLTSFEMSRCIYHSDIKKENFLFDSKKVCIVDFQHVGVLPEPFQTYTFFNINKAFAASVGRKLGYQPSTTVDAMVKISGVLQQCGGTASLRS